MPSAPCGCQELQIGTSARNQISLSLSSYLRPRTGVLCGVLQATVRVQMLTPSEALQKCPSKKKNIFDTLHFKALPEMSAHSSAAEQRGSRFSGIPRCSALHPPPSLWRREGMGQKVIEYFSVCLAILRNLWRLEDTRQVGTPPSLHAFMAILKCF